MYNVIYVPLGDNEALKKQRQELIMKLATEGWELHGYVELRDSLKKIITVQVLMK